MSTVRRSGKNLKVLIDGSALPYVVGWTYEKVPSFASTQGGAGASRPRLIHEYTIERGTIDVESDGDGTLQNSITSGATGALYVEALDLYEDATTKYTADDVWLQGGGRAVRNGKVVRRFTFTTRL